MVRRIRRVLEVGVGPDPTRLIKLSRRHPKTEFTGVETYADNYESHLKDKPANLSLHAGVGGWEHLQGKVNHYDHIYMHFVPSKMPTAERNRFFRRAFLAMPKGGRLIFVDEGNIGRQAQIELQQAGFTVSLKRLTSAEVLKLGTQTGNHLAAMHSSFRQEHSSSDKLAKRFVTQLVEQSIREEEGSNPSLPAREAMRRRLEDSKWYNTTMPFVKVVAIKRK